jgi:hypothetical protein
MEVEDGGIGWGYRMAPGNGPVRRTSRAKGINQRNFLYLRRSQKMGRDNPTLTTRNPWLDAQPRIFRNIRIVRA